MILDLKALFAGGPPVEVDYFFSPAEDQLSNVSFGSCNRPFGQ